MTVTLPYLPSGALYEQGSAAKGSVDPTPGSPWEDTDQRDWSRRSLGSDPHQSSERGSGKM